MRHDDFVDDGGQVAVTAIQPGDILGEEFELKGHIKTDQKAVTRGECHKLVQDMHAVALMLGPGGLLGGDRDIGVSFLDPSPIFTTLGLLFLQHVLLQSLHGRILGGNLALGNHGPTVMAQ